VVSAYARRDVDGARSRRSSRRSASLDAAATPRARSRCRVGSNHAELWNEAATGSSDAAVEPHALNREVALSRGATPAEQYVLEMTIDLVIHAWDLGAAIGYDEPLPAGLVDFAYDQVKNWGDVSGTEYFGAPVEVSADASLQDKLVALTGRDPKWSPS
jgi:uncharacterized protein (TIGR03086 family)